MNAAWVIQRIVGYLVGLISLSFTLVSPSRGETWDGQKRQEYKGKEELSLHVSLFHPHPPAYHPAARPRVCMRPPGETVKHGRHALGTPPGNERRDARGNSRLVHDSLFCRSGSTPGAPPSPRLWRASAQVRATPRPGRGSVGLAGSVEGSRPGATWRERGANPADFSNNGTGPDGRGHNDRSTCHEG